MIYIGYVKYLYFYIKRRGGIPLKKTCVIAQNQSFVQKEVGTKYKTIHIWSYPQNLANLAITSI